MSCWYLVHTKARQEHVALENLARQGFECYLPEIHVEKLQRRKLEVVRVPLFTRYLFIRLGANLESQSWAPIRSTLGVSRLVTFGHTLAKVDDDLISAIKSMEANAGVERRLFQAGDQVVVTSGPFAGVEAIYQATDGEERVMVLINMLSKEVQMAVAPRSIRKTN